MISHSVVAGPCGVDGSFELHPELAAGVMPDIFQKEAATPVWVEAARESPELVLPALTGWAFAAAAKPDSLVRAVAPAHPAPS